MVLMKENGKQGLRKRKRSSYGQMYYKYIQFPVLTFLMLESWHSRDLT